MVTSPFDSVRDGGSGTSALNGTTRDVLCGVFGVKPESTAGTNLASAFEGVAPSLVVALTSRSTCCRVEVKARAVKLLGERGSNETIEQALEDRVFCSDLARVVVDHVSDQQRERRRGSS